MFGWGWGGGSLVGGFLEPLSISSDSSQDTPARRGAASLRLSLCLEASKIDQLPPRSVPSRAGQGRTLSSGIRRVSPSETASDERQEGRNDSGGRGAKKLSPSLFLNSPLAPLLSLNSDNKNKGHDLHHRALQPPSPLCSSASSLREHEPHKCMHFYHH